LRPQIPFEVAASNSGPLSEVALC